MPRHLTLVPPSNQRPRTRLAHSQWTAGHVFYKLRTDSYGWTEQQLASRAGTSTDAVTRFEANEPVAPNQMLRLLNALGIDLENWTAITAFLEQQDDTQAVLYPSGPTLMMKLSAPQDIVKAGGELVCATWLSAPKAGQPIDFNKDLRVVEINVNLPEALAESSNREDLLGQPAFGKAPKHIRQWLSQTFRYAQQAKNRVIAPFFHSVRIQDKLITRALHWRLPKGDGPMECLTCLVHGCPSNQSLTACCGEFDDCAQCSLRLQASESFSQ